MPHPAMAQVGSRCRTSRNALSPSLHQNECRSATARCRGGCPVSLQEFAKETLPSFSAGSAHVADGVATASATARVATNLDMTFSQTDVVSQPLLASGCDPVISPIQCLL